MQYAYNSMKYIYNYFVTQYSYMTMDEFYKDNRFEFNKILRKIVKMDYFLLNIYKNEK